MLIKLFVLSAAGEDKLYVYCYYLAQDIWSTLPISFLYGGLVWEWSRVNLLWQVVLIKLVPTPVQYICFLMEQSGSNQSHASIYPQQGVHQQSVSLPTHLVVAGGEVGGWAHLTLMLLKSTTSTPPSGVKWTNYLMLVVTKEFLYATTQCTYSGWIQWQLILSTQSMQLKLTCSLTSAG